VLAWLSVCYESDCRESVLEVFRFEGSDLRLGLQFLVLFSSLKSLPLLGHLCHWGLAKLLQ